MTHPVRPAAVAGMFYPASRPALEAMIGGFLAEAAPSAGGPAPKAVIAPHAGYVYSGPIAASAYARLAKGAGQVTRVVLVGPAHRVRVRALASAEASAFDSPLGPVAVDEGALSGLPHVEASARAHEREHSLEVHVPFIRTVFPSASIVPLVVGGASPAEVAEALSALWGGRETAVVVSSDLSHYLPYAAGRALDRATCERIVALDERPIEHELACGAGGINGLLRVARQKGLRAELLDLRSSGDTAGGKDEVVGYGSIAFYERPGAPD